MDENDSRVIDIGTRLAGVRTREASALASERIRNLAFQAIKLPNTLSKSEIEELGLAVLTYARQYAKIV